MITEFLGGLMVFFFWVILYLAPTILAYSNNKKNKEAIMLLNLLGGWTFIGWIIAMIWSVMKD